MNIKKISIFLLAIVFIWSCKKDEDSPSPGVTIPAATIDPSDAGAVSSELGTENPTWTEKTGNAPPSDGAISIFSNADNGTVAATNGLPISVDIDIPLGDSLSILFEIEGANAHYEVPADPDGRSGMILRNSSGIGLGFSGGFIKKKMEEARTGSNPGGYLFVFNIPSSIKAGTFCVNFAVTNASGGISNYISFCVQLSQRGGNGSGNLTSKKWKASKQQYFDSLGNLIDEEIFGVLEFVTDTFWCMQGGFELYTRESREDLTFNFRPNGTHLINDIYHSTYVDWDSSVCGSIVFITDDGDDDLEGGWSFDNVTKKMILTINGYYDEMGYYVSPWVLNFEVITNTASKIEFKFDEGADGYWILTLVPA
jgi:hypothetical protein